MCHTQSKNMSVWSELGVMSLTELCLKKKTNCDANPTKRLLRVLNCPNCLHELCVTVTAATPTADQQPNYNNSLCVVFRHFSL